jgi:hypothetical protein
MTIDANAIRAPFAGQGMGKSALGALNPGINRQPCLQSPPPMSSAANSQHGRVAIAGKRMEPSQRHSDVALNLREGRLVQLCGN